jgi:hypothetical protein
VQRVGVARRGLGVFAYDRQLLALAAGNVVGVDDVVHRAGMIRVRLVHVQQQRRRARLIRRRHFGRRDRRKQTERIEGARLGIARICRVHLLERAGPALDALPVVVGVRILEKLADAFDEQALTRGGRQGQPLRRLAQPTLSFIHTRPRRPERLKERHRDSPVRHRALRVATGNLLEPGARLGIRHVVQQRDRSIEIGLHARRARYGKPHRPQRLRPVPVMLCPGDDRQDA